MLCSLCCRLHVVCAGDFSKFPRVHVRDPYKRLGLSSDASEDEVWGSRNFLLKQYAGHEKSEESIESAFEKLLNSSFDKRKKSKINLKSKLKKRVSESPPWIKNIFSHIEVPEAAVISRRFFLFAFMGGWSIMNSAQSGPAFQLAISLAACICFLNIKSKKLAWSSIIGISSLVGGWICGSLLVPLLPSALKLTWSPELLTSLVVYLVLFASCTFIK